MKTSVRLQQSLKPAAIHFACSVLVACLIAMMIFLIWYPYPYDEFSGGRSLFLLIIGVDVVCGPVLTLLFFTHSKPKRLLFLDFSLVIAIQLVAMMYGITVAWHARPVYLVAEIDRFKVITQAEILSADVEKLPEELRPHVLKKPLVVGIRAPASVEEKNKVMFESIQGGRDYAERPEFYIPYQQESARKSLDKSKNLSFFIRKYPSLQAWGADYATARGRSLDGIKYLPVVAREDWIAILDDNGYVVNFLKGDGF